MSKNQVHTNMTSEGVRMLPRIGKHAPGRWIFRAAMVSMVVVLLAGCATLLWQMQRDSLPGHAQPAIPAIPADAGVVGPPTLSAATVNAIFTQVGSPMAGTGATIEAVSRQYHIDDAFALGVWYTETNDGEAGVGSADRNPGSIRGSPGYPSAFDGYTIYPSYTAAILNWFSILSSRYISSGLTTVYSIARPYVGTTSYPLWAGKVINLMYRYRGIAPPPPAIMPITTTPAPKPKPKPVPTVSPVLLMQQHRLVSVLPRATAALSVRAHQGQTVESNRTTPARILAQPALATPSTPAASAAFSSAQSFMLIFAGLLAALLIALYALRVGRSIPAFASVGTNELDTGTYSTAVPDLSPVDTGASLATVGSMFPRRGSPLLELTPMPPISRQFAASLLPESAAEVTTEELSPLTLPAAPTRQIQGLPVRLPSRPPQTDALPRRVQLLPANSQPRVPVPVVPERSNGLLSRYGDK